MNYRRLAIAATLLLIASVVVLTQQFSMNNSQTIPPNLQEELFPGERSLSVEARREGSLVIYAVWDVEDVTTILDAFSKRYPGIDGQYWVASTSEIVARVLVEFEAGQKSVDIILSDSAPPILRAAGAIAPYETVQRDSLLIHDPTMPVVSLQIQALAYNTRTLAPDEVPSSWEEVASPEYKGRVALDDPLRAGPLSHMLAALRSYWNNETRWVNFIKGLKALDVPVHQSTSALFRLVVAGEYSIAMPALLQDVITDKQKGSPIDYVRTAQPIVSPRYAAIFGKSAHLASAKLFAEWLISVEGQRILDSIGRAPARKDFMSKNSVEGAFSAQIQIIRVTDQTYLADPKAWLDRYVKPIWTAP